jgi:sugar O-acyltransferase (sialic acid O-acetyltransferase NeuD family)
MIDELYGKSATILGLFDDTLAELPFSTKSKFYSRSHEIDDLIKNSTHYVVCIGGNRGYARYMISQKLQERGLKPLSVISKHSVLDELNSIGVGTQAMPGAIIHKFTNIGNDCIMNTNSTVDHECNIGNGVHVMVGAAIAGKVNIGNFSTIGTNATVLPSITIGANVYVGAGAVVTKDVEDGVVVVGVPARWLRKFEPIVDLSAFR